MSDASAENKGSPGRASEVEPPPVAAERLPRHIAIIMDGNGRWATRQGLPRTAGHRRGADAVREVVTRAREVGVQYLTLYAFSAQNWSRPDAEVDALMTLLVEFCENERNLLMDKQIRLRMIGQRDRMPRLARSAVETLEELTRENAAMTLSLALSYGAREELTQAARSIARSVAEGALDPAAIDETIIGERLWTAGMPDVDLVVRTSGEFRVSNFLLWQIAYAEFHIVERLWPDFGRRDFDAAIVAYAERDRRFGGLSDEHA